MYVIYFIFMVVPDSCLKFYLYCRINSKYTFGRVSGPRAAFGCMLRPITHIRLAKYISATFIYIIILE